MTERHRCAQCWKKRPLSHFKGALGGVVRRCKGCRTKYDRWDKMTTAEKLAIPRRPFNASGALRVALTMRSGNIKLGPIPVSMTGRGSCPDACSFKGAGCFAEYHILRMHWSRVPTRGMRWHPFCDAVRGMKPGQLWRHNEAGDLPGVNDRIDTRALAELVKANTGRRGFTFTHKPVFVGRHAAKNRTAIADANAGGFVVNLSADSIADADRLAALAIGPVAVVLPEDAPLHATKTPDGRTVVVCPAQTAAHLACDRCRLCSVGSRKAIVGFLAHGQFKKHVTELVQLRRKDTAA